MRARLLARDKATDVFGNLTEYVVWVLPISSLYPEGVRYRFAFVKAGQRAPHVLYDNHHPKGHHKHIGGTEIVYEFSSIEKLFMDFFNDVNKINQE